MATMIIAGEKLTMPVWLKARLLEVLTTDDIAVLSVESGSERGKFYPVRHDGRVALPCPCRATIDKCAHMLAAERYLASVEMLGAEFAQDLPAHVDDELATQQEEESELVVVAEATLVAEYVITAREKCSMTVERKVERTPFGTMVLMR